MSNVRAGILGTGHSYPEGVLTNADLEKMVETSDEWITTRTGIKQRRKAAPDEYTSQFATRASQQAIERAGITGKCPSAVAASVEGPALLRGGLAPRRPGRDGRAQRGWVRPGPAWHRD